MTSQNVKCGVVYSCLAGNYDNLLIHKFNNPRWDYVYFTDVKKLQKKKRIGPWEIRPLAFGELDNTRNNRWHKLHPHILFPEHEKSIYVDGNIDILAPYLFDLFENANKEIMLPRHSHRGCIYDECDECARREIVTRENADRMLEFLASEGMPRNYGLTENNIIFRRHNDELAKKISDEWWEMIRNYSCRDQMSFAYILWRNGIRPEDIVFPNERLNPRNYACMDHTPPRQAALRRIFGDAAGKIIWACLRRIKRCLMNLMPDSLYLKKQFKAVFGYSLDLKKPETFNEKLQWLKLYDRNPLYTRLADKYEARKFVAEKIGDEHLIPLLGVWDSVDEINFEKLPNEFVLKCTHDSGSIVICKDKNNFDAKQAKSKLKKELKENFYHASREWPYKNVRPRIIAEKFMVDESGTELKDYKIFCFNGEPKVIQVDFDRFKNHKRNLYDTEWNYIPVSVKFPTNPNRIINKPSKLEEMLKQAKALSKNIPHVRVDFYSIYNKIYFGELTFTHGAGYEKFEPEKYNEIFGSWINLPKIKGV
jgi:hypothetical protein